MKTALLLMFLGCGVGDIGAGQPNVVLILADDLGYGDLSCYDGGCDEGGVRIPLIARWPGTIPADSKNDSLIALTDMQANRGH